jgi:hypothetical protein
MLGAGGSTRWPRQGCRARNECDQDVTRVPVARVFRRVSPSLAAPPAFQEICPAAGALTSKGQWLRHQRADTLSQAIRQPIYCAPYRRASTVPFTRCSGCPPPCAQAGVGSAARARPWTTTEHFGTENRWLKEERPRKAGVGWGGSILNCGLSPIVALFS